MKSIAAALLAPSMLATLASAGLYTVTITGEVEYNQINTGVLDPITAGAPVTITFTVDSAAFVNSANFPTRGYVVDKPSFTFKAGNVTVPLKNPFPAGTTPYFTLRNNDPQVDGFFLGTDFEYGYTGVPLNSNGIFGPFAAAFAVSYAGNTLSSLNIEDAVGSYDYTGLGSFYLAVQDGSFDAMGLLFTGMTIAPVAAPCPADLNGDGEVNGADLGILLAAWGGGGAADINGSGTVDGADLGILLAAWGSCG